MTDIVERLRIRQFVDGSVRGNILGDAADEIERLRKENELLRLGWCKELEKRMKDWQDEPIATPNIITTGDTQCRHCNGVGQIQVAYPGQRIEWTMCNRCNGSG